VAFFIQDAGVDIGVNVGVANMEASAHLGFIGIGIDNTSSADLALDLKLQLHDNQANSSRIFLSQLDDSLTDIRFTGSAVAPASAALPANGKLTAMPPSTSSSTAAQSTMS